MKPLDAQALTKTQSEILIKSDQPSSKDDNSFINALHSKRDEDTKNIHFISVTSPIETKRGTEDGQPNQEQDYWKNYMEQEHKSEV